MLPTTYAWGSRSVVWSVDLSPDGRWLAAGGMMEAAFCVWDRQSGEIVVEQTALGGEVDVGTEVRFSPDGTLRIRLNRKEIWVSPDTWRTAKKGAVKGSFLSLPGPNGLVCICCRPSQRSKWQVLAEIFDEKSSKRVATIQTPQNARGVQESVADATWLPDGNLAVAHTISLGVGIYDGRTGALIRRLEDAPNKRKYRGNDSVSIDRTGRWIATTRQDDRIARVWSLADNHLVHEVSGHAKTHIQSNSFHALQCRFGPDGITLAVNAGQKKRGGAVTLHALGATRAAASTACVMDEDEAQADAVAALIEETVRALASLPDAKAGSIDPVLRRYLKQGRELGCSPAELHDYFSVSSPSMPEQAGLGSRQAHAVEKRYGNLSEKLFAAKRS